MTNIIILDARNLTEEQEVKLLLAIHKYMQNETPSEVMLTIGIWKNNKIEGVVKT